MRCFSLALLVLLGIGSAAPIAAADTGGDVRSLTIDHSDPMIQNLPGRFVTVSVAGFVPAPGSPTGALDLDLDPVEPGAYGLARLLLATDGDPRQQLATLSLRLDGRREVFEDVSVHLLQRLFAQRGLRTPIVVDRAETPRLSVRAASSDGAGNLRLGAVLLTEEQLAVARAAGVETDPVTPRGARRGGIRRDEPLFLARTVSVPAGTAAFPVRFADRGTDVDVHRVLASCDTEAAETAVTLTVRGDAGDLLPALAPVQLAMLFGERNATPPLHAAASRPLTVYIDNPTGAAVRVSLLLEASAA